MDCISDFAHTVQAFVSHLLLETAAAKQDHCICSEMISTAQTQKNARYIDYKALEKFFSLQLFHFQSTLFFVALFLHYCIICWTFYHFIIRTVGYYTHSCVVIFYGIQWKEWRRCDAYAITSFCVNCPFYCSPSKLTAVKCFYCKHRPFDMASPNWKTMFPFSQFRFSFVTIVFYVRFVFVWLRRIWPPRFFLFRFGFFPTKSGQSWPIFLHKLIENQISLKWSGFVFV